MIEGVGRLVRTAALERVLRVGPDVTDEALHAAYGLVTVGADGWVATDERDVPRYEGKMKPPVERESGERRGLFGRLR